MTTEEKPEHFGVVLQRYRLAAGLSQEELAEQAGLSRRGISDLERGARRAPRMTTVRRLSHALGLKESERGVLLSAVRGSAGTAERVKPVRELARHNLPLQLTSFIGREKDLVEVQRSLAGARLATLTGPGGVGKTRLALRVAESVLDRYPDGVWFLDLAPLVEPTLVPQFAAAVLGIREKPDEALLTTLTRTLQPRQLLLILDNCEHVLGASIELVESLLRGCPRLHVLTTSREILGIGAERVWRVPPLGLPDWRHPPELTQLAQFDAVRLFIDRARAAKPDFSMTSQNAPVLAQICHRLDGIPLAIELAAARLRVLSLKQIEGRLAEHFRILSCGSRLAPERQQTLRATIDWSVDLLSNPERRLFRQLAVFASGWTVEAAEVVCCAAGDQSDDVLNLLTALVDKSIVVAAEPEDSDQDEPRYRFLETVRAYAADRLLASGEIESTRDRHLAWATEWAEAATPFLTGPNQVRWMDRFVRELDNFRGALEWARLRGNWESELRLVAALARFWVVHGPTTEARGWFAHALSVGFSAPSLARATVLDWAGRLASLTGEPGSRQLLEQSVSMARQLNSQSLLALGLRHLAFAALQQGDNVAARALHEEALGLARMAHNRREEAFALAMIGLWEAQEGDVSGAARIVEEALEAGREAGDQGPQATAFCARGIIAVREGRIEAATVCFHEALTLGRATDHYLGVAMALMQLGALALAGGDPLQARGYARECVAAAQEAGVRRLVAAALQFFAQVELYQHRYKQGVRIAAAETNWREASPERRFLGLPWISAVLALDQARRYLGPAGFSREWSIGQRMTLEQAAALTTDP